MFNDALIGGLVATRAFRRLKGVRFLGGIDYVLVRSPNGSRSRYSRYEHSVGVACLAAYHADLSDLPPDERRLSCAAALLHDIGHAPLSHSLEPVFQERFGLEHHKATKEIIYGLVPIGVEIARYISPQMTDHSIGAPFLLNDIIRYYTSWCSLENCSTRAGFSAWR